MIQEKLLNIMLNMVFKKIIPKIYIHRSEKKKRLKTPVFVIMRQANKPHTLETQIVVNSTALFQICSF